MKTTTFLAMAAAAAFLLTSGPTYAAEAEGTQTQMKEKRCYRTNHKQLFRVRVPCRKVADMKTEPMKPAPSEPAPQPAPEKKP